MIEYLVFYTNYGNKYQEYQSRRHTNQPFIFMQRLLLLSKEFPL